jgi:hypothetical protein
MTMPGHVIEGSPSSAGFKTMVEVQMAQVGLYIRSASAFFKKSLRTCGQKILVLACGSLVSSIMY